MSTDAKPQLRPSTSISSEEIWRNLEVTDQQENPFPFSNCRNRHIVVLGSRETPNHIVGELIEHDAYYEGSHYQTNEEQNTITYVTVPDDSSCNVCIINLIDIPPLEHFTKLIDKNRKDSTPSLMAEVDEAIYKFATYINLIVLVCRADDWELMKNMKKWASDRGQIMALAVIVEPILTLEGREGLLSSIRKKPEFLENNLGEFFKEIFCISELSYNHFRTPHERKVAQTFVKEWRSKFLRKCIGGPNDPKYVIQLNPDKQSKDSNLCNLS